MPLFAAGLGETLAALELVPARVICIGLTLSLIVVACGGAPRETPRVPAPTVDARPVGEPGPIPVPARRSVLASGTVAVPYGPSHLYPELTPYGAWGGANAVELAAGRRARMIRNCSGDSLIVALTFADALSTDALVVVKLGAAWDAPEATAEWDAAMYLATVQDAAAADLLEQIARAGVDTVTTWVVDTLARVYPMAVTAREVLAACPR